MSQQQNYGFQRDLGHFPGERVGTGFHRARPGINDLGLSPQIDDIVIGTAPPVAQSQLFVIPASPDDSVNYTITINGVACVAAADASSTQAEVQAAMIIAINTAVGSVVTATAATNDVLVTADVAGVPFTFSIDTSTTADITAGTAVANVGDGTVYAFTVNGESVSYTASRTNAVQDVRDGLIAAGRAVSALAGVVVFNPSASNQVRVQAAVPGTAFTSAESSSLLSIVLTQANVASQAIPFGRAIVKRTTGANVTDQSMMLPSAASQRFMGIAERMHHTTSASAGGDSITPGSNLSVGYDGPWYVQVEVAVAVGDPVYFRFTATGTQAVGEFRNDADTATADLISRAEFVTSTTGRGVAIMKLVG